MEASGSELDEAQTILLVSAETDESDRCRSLLSDRVTNVLFVTYERSVADRLTRTDRAGKRTGIITVGEAEAQGSEDESIETKTVPDPDDTAGLIATIDQFLSAWDGSVTICFDSLTATLRHVEFERAFAFLHTLLGKAHAADASIHVHIDPSEHGTETIAAVTSLFDATVRDDEVRTRDLL